MNRPPAGVPGLLRIVFASALLLAMAVPGMPVRAATEGVAAARAVPTLDAMQKELANYRDIPPEDQQGARLRDLYSSAVQSLRDVASQRSEQARFERLQADAPTRAASANADLAALERARVTTHPVRVNDVARLERMLADERTRLDEMRARETELAGTLATLQARGDKARAELKSLSEAAASAKPAPVAMTGDASPLADARIDEWRAQQELRTATRVRLETEIRTLPLRITAVQAQLKLATAQREKAEAAVAELLGLEHLRRIAQAEQVRDEVAAHVAEADVAVPELAELAEEVAALAAEYVQVVTRFETGRSDLAQATRVLADLRTAYESTRQQTDVAELDDALGPVLAAHYRRLAVLEKPGRPRAELSEELSSARLREFRLGEMRQSAEAARMRIDAALQQAAPTDASARRRSADAADALLADRDSLVDSLSDTYSQVADQIVDIEQVYGDQASLAQRFRELLDRNLVWMRSDAPLSLGDLLAWPVATWNLLAGQDWATTAADLRAAVTVGELAALALGVVLVLLLRLRLNLRQVLPQLALSKGGWAHYGYSQALRAFGIHLLLALPVPLGIAWLGWVVEGAADPLATAIGRATFPTALVTYFYLFVLGVLGPDGVARAHLRWRPGRVQAVASRIRRMVALILPLGFLSLVMRDIAPVESAIAPRIGALVVSVVFLAVAVSVGRAGRGMFSTAFFKRGYPLVGRVVNVLVVVVLGLQVLAVVLDVQGYHFTAYALQISAFTTLVVFALARLVIDGGLLGLAVAARRSQAALAEEGAAAEGPEPEADIDLEKMNASAVALLHVAVVGLTLLVMAALWHQFFTALSILDTVGLWNYQSTVDGKDVELTVSVFDLLGAVAAAVLSVVLAKGLPALLGIVLYGFVTRKGVLYAIQTIISYAVGVIGAVISLQMLGFGWSKLQWMAAGLSVGVGFGMQEIFANFFAGLIMLFERPVRIGDVVTLGEYSGTIQRIKMRATTITDFDNREIIVPNKMFVTERLINWTLSSSVVRLSFDVGVSYDSDPRQVRETLLGLLAEDPRVLADPAPNVVFTQFGASTLDFRCFVHVEDVNLRMPVQNDLHMRITEVFREKGIEIAYPQMDLHLRSVQAAARDALGGTGT